MCLLFCVVIGRGRHGLLIPVDFGYYGYLDGTKSEPYGTLVAFLFLDALPKGYLPRALGSDDPAGIYLLASRLASSQYPRRNYGPGH